MLTLAEAIKAIAALPTEPDVITNACLRTLELSCHADADIDADPTARATKTILDIWPNRLSQGDMIEALIASLGIYCAMAVKENNEKALITGLIGRVMEQFFKSRISIIEGSGHDVRRRLIRLALVIEEMKSSAEGREQ